MTSSISSLLTRLGGRRGVQRQQGATLVEYALIIAVIAIAVLVGGVALSDRLDTFFNTTVADAIQSPEG